MLPPSSLFKLLHRLSVQPIIPCLSICLLLNIKLSAPLLRLSIIMLKLLFLPLIPQCQHYFLQIGLS